MQGNRLQIVYNKKSRVCRGGYDPPALNNVIQALKMLIAAIRFFRADDIRPYNERIFLSFVTVLPQNCNKRLPWLYMVHIFAIYTLYGKIS